MKLICVCLSFAILLTGCYSHTTITKDDPLPPPNVEVTFRLNDGTHILSHEYQRIGNGYHIVGKLNGGHFDGIVPDDIISEVVIVKYEIGTTIGVVLLCVGTVVLIVGVVSTRSFTHGGW
jgi:hypothetical protein